MIASWWKVGVTPVVIAGAVLLSGCAGSLPSGIAEMELPAASPEAVVAETGTSSDFNVDFSFLGGAFETEDLHWVGTVEAIADTQWTVSGIVLSVDATSKIDSGLALGDPAEVEAAFLADGRLFAREIQGVSASSPAPLQGSELEFVGLVEAIGVNSWIVAGFEVAISAQTEIKGTLAVGDLAKVHALVGEDEKLTAREIEPAAAELGDDQFVDEVEFTGKVESIGASAWTIGGRTVLVSTRTEVESGLAVGDLVKVHGVYDSEGKLVAREIELEDDEEHQALEGEMDFTGIVQAITAASITIDGKTFTLTPQSEVEGSITIGDLVKVHVFMAPDGTLTVRELEPEDHTMDGDHIFDDDSDDDSEDELDDHDEEDDDSGGGDDTDGDGGDDNS